MSLPKVQRIHIYQNFVILSCLLWMTYDHRLGFHSFWFLGWPGNNISDRNVSVQGTKVTCNLQVPSTYKYLRSKSHGTRRHISGSPCLSIHQHETFKSSPQLIIHHITNSCCEDWMHSFTLESFRSGGPLPTKGAKDALLMERLKPSGLCKVRGNGFSRT